MTSPATDWDESEYACEWGDPELARVLALAPSVPCTPEEVAQLTRHLSRPGADVELRQKQADACRDMLMIGGCVGSLPTGEGKCWGRGTPMLLADGRSIAIEDVRVGHELMGPDSVPRLVLSITSGVGPLYRVSPIKGDAWVCNDAHILTIVDTFTNMIEDVSVRDFLRRAPWKQGQAKLFQPELVTFTPAAPLPVDPYFLGVWYGDGTKALAGVCLTKPDPEIGALAYATATAWGLRVREQRDPGKCPQWHLVSDTWRGNRLLTTMREICGDARSIPHSYLTASVEDRRALLAGLIDSDGHLTHGNYEIVQRECGIADGIAFVARSLGFRVTRSIKVVNGAGYHRLRVLGDSTALPLRIPRKITGPRQQKKDPLRTGFSLDPIGVGDYFGVTLTGDGRCLLADFTVTHNTLATLVIPTLLNAQRPALILPASALDKTRTEFAEYLADGWLVRLPKLFSYQILSHRAHERDLLEYAPDVLLLDEADEARNIDGTGFGRRIRRALHQLPQRPRVGILSATLIGDDLMEYWELVLWALQGRAPVPLHRAAAERWASATNRVVKGVLRRREPGGLAQIPGGFHAWLRSRAGVVSGRGETCPAEIQIKTWTPPISPELRAMIDRCALTGKRPDGERVTEWELPDLMCMMAQGFYQIWDPLPPTWWLQPRRAWLEYESAVRDAQIEGFDTPSQIREALDDPKRQPQPPAAREARALLEAWRVVKDRFEPNAVPVWITGAIMDAAAAHAQQDGMIVWVKHVAPGMELARRGLPYYGADTQPHQHRPAGAPIVCSIKAHGRGKNLQAWYRSLVLHPPAKARLWEQLISRQHRPGQTAPTVFVDIIAGIPYHGEVLERVWKGARADSEANGVPHKFMLSRWS